MRKYFWGMSGNKIKVTLVRSPIGRKRKIRQILRGLGLTRLNRSVILENTPSIRGMIRKVIFMLKIESINEGEI